MGKVMNMEMATADLSNDEKLKYIDSTANQYFRTIYYSKEFSNIVSKLDSKEKLTEEEWTYLINRLFMVTYKANLEEDPFNSLDKINYLINKIGVKIFKKGKIHNECVKMLAFLESVKLEEEINNDLFNGLERAEKSKNDTDLDILLRQHREAVIFRDNQDAFLDSYKESKMGYMTDDEILYIDCMDRAYIREKNLVKGYK